MRRRYPLLIEGSFMSIRAADPRFFLRFALLASLLGWQLQASAQASSPLAGEAAASSSAAGFQAKGAIDGDRFSVEAKNSWKGKSGENSWWWQIHFPEPRAVGAILQVHGDHPSVLRNAPKRYVWRWSPDGTTWHNLQETETKIERRIFRIHRLKEAVLARYLRLQIFEAAGEAPTLREIEVYAEPKGQISFDDWLVAVSTDEASTLPAEGQRFIHLAKSCKGYERVLAQEVWLGSFDESFIAAEPRPLCAFLTGNIPEWCERMHEPWRGTEEVLKKRNLPMWAACGGAQGLAILEDVGVDKPWDCPRCRDPKNPKLPIYTHIGHTGKSACGDYSQCTFERGKFKIVQEADDPVFAGLPREMDIIESHCGQIEYPPKGWVRIATKGAGTLTRNQCLRVKERYIYAAQFHIELDGTPENSRKIMSNFLSLAKKWGGYNPQGKAVREPPRTKNEDK